MYSWQLESFGVGGLRWSDVAAPTAEPDQILVEVEALSLNYRDLLVVTGKYNPKLKLPAVPISDASGRIVAVGENVRARRVGERIVTHFVAGWQDGPFQGGYLNTSLGTPGPGLAAECVALPESACLPLPAGYDAAQAATLPIAALTAWSALVTEGRIQPGQTVLTLGTGGVSIFAVQIGAALGARVFVTSSSDEKLARARQFGAAGGVNYRTTPEWERAVLDLTGGVGVDLVVETGGAATLNQSMRATKPGGRLAILGALSGLQAEVSTALILMKRLTLNGIYVDSRAAFERMNAFLAEKQIRPVIDRTFRFDELPAALRYLESGRHFGKIVLTR